MLINLLNYPIPYKPVTFLKATGAKTTVTPVPKDMVTAASIVDSAAAFEKAIVADGKWIIALTKDITVDKDLFLEGHS